MGGLRLYEKQDDFRMRDADTALNRFDCLLYLWRGHIVGELYAQRRNDLARGKMDRQCTVGADDPGLRLGNAEDRGDKRRMRALADQQILAFSRHHAGGY